MYEEILYEVSDPTAIITLNRPDKLNAWTDVMDREVRDALREAENDTRVVGTILTGAGRAFCAGADMSSLQSVIQGERGEFKAAKQDPGDPHVHPAYRMHYSYIASLRKPVIAAIHGACAGMAVPISCFCDLRFASETAMFMTAFSRRGLIAEWGCSWMLPRLVGMSNAIDLLLSSRKVLAAEALQMGLVNRVVPEEDLLGEAKAYIQELADNCSPKSMALMKRQLYQHWQSDLAVAWNETMRLMTDSFTSPDFKEGVDAFLEKRPTHFERVGN